jgi:hypothetical protein
MCLTPWLKGRGKSAFNSSLPVAQNGTSSSLPTCARFSSAFGLRKDERRRPQSPATPRQILAILVRLESHAAGTVGFPFLALLDAPIKAM